MKLTQTEPETFSGAKILIVDDYPGNIDILCQAMPVDFQIRTALGGQDALDLLQRTKFIPDLILLDVMMPEMDGYEVCRQLKLDARYREVPVIFVSAVADTQSKIKGLEIGGVDYITKPYNFREVKARIAIHLKLHQLNQRVVESNRQLETLVKKRNQDKSEAQIELIHALSSLLSLRDPISGGHIERTRAIIQILGQELQQHPVYRDQVDAWYVEQLAKASPLHDIGKVSVPDKILNKSVLNDPDELDIMIRHTEIGARTLADVRDHFPGTTFLDVGIDMAQSHHERWDGRGYPDGLKGNAIPLAAQIMALADTLDYRYADAIGEESCLSLLDLVQPALTFEPEMDVFTCVRLQIHSESGTTFAEELVDVYLRVADSIEAIYRPASL